LSAGGAARTGLSTDAVAQDGSGAERTVVGMERRTFVMVGVVVLVCLLGARSIV